jgi:hypothetical protein
LEEDVEPLVSAIGRSGNGHCTVNQLLGFFESFLESTDLPEAEDRIPPEWNTAKAQFDRAIDLLSNAEADSWPFYYFNRAICSIELDANFVGEQASDAATRRTIIQDLRTTQRGVGEFGELLKQPHNVDVRKWLQLNGSPRLD